MRLFSVLILAIPLLAACPEEEKETETDVTDTDETDQPTEDCQAVELDEGATGTYTINSAGDDHVKHHFLMPEGANHIIATATWTETEWKMLLDLGIGFCPHSGTSMAQTTGEGGEVTLELWSTDLEEPLDSFTADDQWFVHLGEDMPVNPEDGSTSDYAFDVQVCTPL